ncbi:ABC transporter permease [Flavobacterium sp. PL002]|uniref:ABC transporter permease n=1 Tax=Flavobacterium sp. PL002 TaxID=1897058 RepID=UPI001788133B|nr:ABC transporter permease [Flavobacterium sp. PL002]MBE0390312.1 Macrolide export ATP-binding/permease protein MacB [Flavobacterium sp. PL002]
MLHNWIKIFIYHLKQNKLFSFLNVLGLSIGIAGLIFALLYWNDEHSYDAWNPEKENVYLVVNQMDVTTFWASSSAPIGGAVAEENSNVQSYCYISGDYSNDIIRFKNKKVQSDKILSAQKNFFEYFPFEFIEGNVASALPDENSICLSDKIAFQLFGNQKALGKEVVFENKKVLVRGVYKSNKNSSYNPSAVVNFIDFRLKKTEGQWGNYQYVLFVKANPISKTDIEKTLTQLYHENMTVRYAKRSGISAEEFVKKYGEVKPSLEPLSAIRLHTKTGGLPEGKGSYQLLLIMLGLSVLILVLSIVNYINLATASAIKRAKEVGVRKIIGASRSNIILQFIFETILIALFSILLSLAIVELALPFYNEFLEKSIILIGSQFYLQLITIFIITVVVAGVFPAVYVSSFETLKVLKGNFGRSKSGLWLRNGMLIFQFTVASFFIVGSYIVYQQIEHINTKDFGFKANQIINLNYRNIYGEEISDANRYERYNSIKNKLLNIKGVKKVAGGAFEFGNGAKSTINYHYKDISIDGNNIPIDFGMLEMMQIKMVKGRFFNLKFAQDTIGNMLINETAMKMLHEKNPIGKKIDWDGKEMIIVGVVKDFNVDSPTAVIPPLSFFHLKTIPWFMGTLNNIYIEVTPESMTESLADIEKLWLKDVDPDYPFVYDFVDKEYKRSYSSFVKQKNMFSVLNIIVILIALFGLFALASYSIERRMKEIAIRKTLGAETNVLLTALSKQYIFFCVIGFLIALFPIYYSLNKWLENFAYRIDISIYPFIIGFLALLFLTLSVVLSRAYFATKVDVLKYLKYE